ncbi:PhnM protein [Granulibacter bethesdensis CGDNIH1]|uniref:PhnM protein n=1 Tax=Granulibacter bethesdensis (strain ATCC BAA-1260 / CGDNIH1) TaxID=391165 RepID=Q0BT35_GRABC|nr:PhnM protein [Granulibacter bethesdensis CGDNIH1]APH51837.1 PhnM protein [Granulibacter bethesdensis]APH64528.1 PhnM protein [Granulibacter bethesdensis]
MILADTGILVHLGEMHSLVLTNARIVLPDRVVETSITIADGVISSIGSDSSLGKEGEDLEGDLLIPGLIDLHTDNLERQVLPRQNARFPSVSAFLAHDAQCVAAGITTVFDSLCLGNLGFEEERMLTCRDGVKDLDTLTSGNMLKAEHFLHLRCEMPAPDTLDMLRPLAEHPRLKLASLMDHVPGYGQYSDLTRYRALLQSDGYSVEETENQIQQAQARRSTLRRPNRNAILDLLRPRGVALASHDDRTEEEIAENTADGVKISEFPVSLVAAQAARAAGMAIIGGAPNVVRGGSHSGNVSVAELLQNGLIDALASDYVPFAMLEAAFMAASIACLDLPAAIRLVTEAPATMTGLHDRGRIAPGLRADLVRVHVHLGTPVVRAVWRQGERVA